jgi:hypothetical protein
MEVAMRFWFVLLAALASCGTLASAERPDFSGKWNLSPEHTSKDVSPHLTIEQSADELRIRSSEGSGDQVTDISCNTVGKDCEAKVNGSPATVSYYFNGQALVSWVKEGRNADRVRKVRRTLSPDGARMTVEIEQVSPPDSGRHTIVYVRDRQVAGVAAAGQQPQP